MIDFSTLTYCQRRNPSGVARLAAFVGLSGAPARPELTEQWLSQVERACRFQSATQKVFRVHEMLLVRLEK